MSFLPVPACDSGASRYCWPTASAQPPKPNRPKEGHVMSAKLNSKEIRKRIGHPVIDADGHWLEFGPSISDYMKDVAGADAVNSFRRRGGYVQKSLTMT